MSIDGIILAAGCSTRAERFKMTEKLLGKPVIEYAVETMSKVCSTIIVVAGHQSEKLFYLPRKYANVRIVQNDLYPQGMFCSVMAGLKASFSDRVFVIPGDYPAVSVNTVFCMKQRQNCDILVPSYRGKIGHPVLLRKEAVSKLQRDGFLTLWEFISQYGYQILEVDDPGILLDIDYPEDFWAIADYLRKQHAHNHNRFN